MMRKIGNYSLFLTGAVRPVTGVLRPTMVWLGVVLGGSLFAVGCGSQEQDRNLKPVQVGLTKAVKPIFDDGETQLFEVKKGVQFPIIEPDKASQSTLEKDQVEPYGRAPWITTDDVKVQLTWTLSNLDTEEHVVEVLIDPWNEFGRYYPGMQLANAEEQKFEPNLSGIDQYFVLGGVGTGEASRRHGTFTFDDLKELAIDFATVQNLIKNPPTGLPGGSESKDDVLPVYANHAFNIQNRSYDDPLTAPYIPKVIAGLTGIDFGFRTSKASAATTMGTTPSAVDVGIDFEISIEIVDLGKDRVQQDGSSAALLAPTQTVVTVGSPVPTVAPTAM